MDIQFVLTEEAPTFEFTIPAEQHRPGGSAMAIISGIAPAIEADAEADPPVEAVAANSVDLQYILQADVDEATGAALAAAWVNSGKTFTADGLHEIPFVGMGEGKMRFVLSGERDMRIRVVLW